jgi:hypothetical protein
MLYNIIFITCFIILLLFCPLKFLTSTLFNDDVLTEDLI